MSETDSFVDEVNEELRRERLFRSFRRYGPWVILALVAFVAWSAWTEWQRAERLAEAERAGEALRAALAAPTPAARLAALDTLPAAEASGPAARLARASALAALERREEAAAVLAAVADDPAAGPVWREAARLRRVALLGPALPQAERLALLEPMTAAGQPFRLLALEQRAIARIEAGDREGARADLAEILADAWVTPDLRRRATDLLTALGGAPAPARS